MAASRQHNPPPARGKRSIGVRRDPASRDTRRRLKPGWRHHRRHPERPKVRCQVIQNNSGYFLILSLPTSTKQMNEQKPGNKQPFNKPQISVRPMQPPKTNPPDCSQESARKCTPKSLQIQPINPSQTRKSQFNPKTAPQKPKIQHSNPSPKAPKTTPKITRLFPQSKNHPANIKALLGKPHPTSPNPKPKPASPRLNCSIGITARRRRLPVGNAVFLTLTLPLTL